ncbi:MAG TPA: hypothetical protein VGP81_01910 [Pyrinomonadaceae bacterium]|nr:hypothetical protein [Pyrinomonadaceae bacterium]
MRVTALALSFGLIALAAFFAFHFDGRHANADKTTSVTVPVKHDFDKEIRPILQARCQPCHFQGGQVYDKLPFDKPATITRLGTKLFTRIEDEKEQKLIREFLAEN